MKLTTRLVTLYLLISLVPLWVIGYFGYKNGIETINNETRQRLSSTNELKSAEVNRWIHSAKAQLQALAQRPLVLAYTVILIDENFTLQDKVKANGKLLKDHFRPGISYGVGFLDLSIIQQHDGRIVASTRDDLSGKYRDQRPFFIQGQKRTYVDEMAYEVGLEQLVMHISTPIKGEGGETIAVLAGQLDWSVMSQIMAQGRQYSNTEESYLVNKSNYFLTESRFIEGLPFNKTLHTVGVERCLAKEDGVELYDDYRGVPVIGAFQWMPEWNLCILTEKDQSEAFAPAVEFRNIFLGVGLAAAVAASLFSWLFAHAIAGRIKRLVVGAEEFGKGNLDYRIETRGGDEIGRLAESFNEMASARKASEDVIRKSRDELEDRVKERTTEISRANEKLVKEIIERKQIENALRESEEKSLSSLAEKEVLLREIHHRVKNNMQIIQSLINLQSKKTVDAELRQALKDSNSRIKSMSLIHETLYRSENLATLDLDKYFRQLATHLIKLYTRARNRIEIEYDIDALVLDMDCSIACGLIVNELVTNALKYAFDDGAPGKVTISLQRVGKDKAKLSVVDNGKGLPRLVKKVPQHTLGLKIVTMLAEDQLQGRMAIDGASGAKYQIEFPVS